MKAMKRIILLILPYKGLAALNMLFNLIQILAGLFSLGLLMPLLDFMFNNNKEAIKPRAVEAGASTDFNSMYNAFIQWMTEYVQNDKKQALLLICIALIIATIIKNIARYLALYYLVILRNRSIENIRKNIFQKILAF